MSGGVAGSGGWDQRGADVGCHEGEHGLQVVGFGTERDPRTARFATEPVDT
ncbi:hypothetical protein SAMN05216215_1006121 [Saccharopolyspora shandongensis]|uniref:Uncharacterized protein n=1 Tax=Saccharopolyspora shandongensis TaxID=418495 RepID=A0A1H2XKF5_9PSEU|nr:hypothetical protein [Saccharopolyspora shandongensis]SDW93381.1 hypothetical protein SAMN05216215_1006121 [Saccharopolyspora shandongensis]